MATYQAGVRPTRLEWVQETTEGTAPTDPQWNIFSDNVQNAWGWEPDANTQRQDGIGEITAQGFFNGTETHEATFAYDLQQWYVDGSGDTVDAGGDFLEPASDNSVKTTHTVVSWSEQSDGGTAGNGRYVVTVGKGGHPGGLTAPFQTDDGSPIEQELSYQFQKIRQYDVNQPDDAGETLTVNNDSSSEVDVTVENYDASEQETLTVSAGGDQTTTNTYSSLGAVELSTDVDGDVTVEDSEGTPNTLVTINGSDSYPAGEGDLGIPATGASGSHASALNSEYVRFLDDTLTIPNVESGVEIISGEMSVETGLESNSKTGSAQQNIHAATWTYTVTATLAGSHVSVDQTTNYLTETTGTVTWTAGEGSIDFNNAFIQSPGEYTKEPENGKMQFDNEFEAETITVSN
jgi:hypothetical protein